MKIPAFQKPNFTVVKSAKITHMAASLLFIVMGLLIMLIPSFDGQLRYVCLGILSILIGGTGIFGYFSNDAYRIAFQSDFALGIFNVFLGILLLMEPEGLPEMLPAAAGIIVLLDGGNKSQNAIEGRNFGMSAWPAVAFSAFLEIAAGCILLYCSSRSIETRYWLGASLILVGIVNDWTTLYMVRIRKKTLSDEKIWDDQNDPVK